MIDGGINESDPLECRFLLIAEAEGEPQVLIDDNVQFRGVVVGLPAATDNYTPTALIDCANYSVSCEPAFYSRLVGVPVFMLSDNNGCAVVRPRRWARWAIRST